MLVDDVSDNGRAKANAGYLVRDLGIKLLLGPCSSGLTNEVAAISHASTATLLAPAASSLSVCMELPERRVAKREREIVRAAVKLNCLAFRYSAAELKADRVAVLVAVKQQGLAFQYAAAELTADRDIVLAADKQNGLAFQ